MLQLTSQERSDCEQRFAFSGEPAPEIDPLAQIDPEKRARFDAEWTADHSPQHMVGIGCAITFGVGKPKSIKVIRALKLGRLPCFVFSRTAAVVQ